MSCKRKSNAVDCWLFDVNDIADLVFGFLPDVQLDYWITQATQDSPLLEMLIRTARVLDPCTLCDLMKSSVSRSLLEKADRKTNLHAISNEGGWCFFLLHASIWWIQQHAKKIPLNNYITIYIELSPDRAHDIFDALDVRSLPQRDQADLFIDVCYGDDIGMVSWFWDNCNLQGYKLAFDFVDMYPNALAFVLEHCTCAWNFRNSSVNLSLAHVKLLETKWPDRMPTLVNALQASNFDVAVYLWPNRGVNYFANFDAVVEQVQRKHDTIRTPCKTKSQQQYSIVFEDHANFNHYFEPPIRPHKKLTFSDLDFLVRHVVAQSNPDSKLHQNTIRWLGDCLREHCRDAYFWQACRCQLGALVMFLWNNVDDTTRASWSPYLSFCLPSWDHELLLFTQAQIPQFVTDNIDVIVHQALIDNNVVCWKFGLPLLTQREAYRVCQLSMEHHSRFFIEAWPYVKHQHANALFDLALARRNRKIAQFLLLQPELKLESLGDRLSVFIEMRLANAISGVSFPQNLPKEQMLWCAQRTLKNQNGDVLRALYPRLHLARETWRQLLVEITDVDFAKALLQCELITGSELFARDQTRFLRILDVVHFDV